MAVPLLGMRKEIAEYQARGDDERVYHEIRQVLRASGVNLVFRKWAAHEGALPRIWAASRPALETRAFETAADRLRADSVRLARPLGAVHARPRAGLGESQAWQLQRALEVYHYLNPKLLLLVSAVGLAMEGRSDGRARLDGELIERGVPSRMYPMEMVSKDTTDERIGALFSDIRQTLKLNSVNSDYRTLALWPDYLEAAWDDLKPIVQKPDYADACGELGRRADELAQGVPVIREELDGVTDTGIVKTTQEFAQLLPGLIINMTLVSLEWIGADRLQRSPFPAARRERAA